MTNGRTANNRGRKAENDVAAWLQANGFPDAERSASKIVDRGDIAGVPGTCIEVKHCNDPMRALRDAQREALAEAFGRRPVAVVRLPGVTDPAKWWAAVPDESTDSEGWIFSLPPEWSVPARSAAVTLHRGIEAHGWVRRGPWLVTTVDRLFAALPQAVVS